MAICTYCGATIEDNSRFCTECGKPYTSSKASESGAEQPAASAAMRFPGQSEPALSAGSASSMASSPSDMSHQAPSQAASAPVYIANANDKPAKGSKYYPTSLFGYFGWLLLFFIPGIGTIISAVVACMSTKASTKRFALAWFIITTGFLIACVVLHFFVLDPDFFPDLYNGIIEVLSMYEF